MTTESRPSPPTSGPPAALPAGDPDGEALQAFRDGDPAAFEVLLSRHERRILRLANRLLGDAESALDAAQETFVKAWRALPRFQGASRFSTWLTRIAINQCRNEIRRRRTVKHARPLSLDETPPGGEQPRRDLVAAREPEPSDRVEEREAFRAFQAALRDLDAEGREILVLRDVEDLSYEGIAEILDVAVGTVRSRLHRARAELRRRMGAAQGR